MSATPTPWRYDGIAGIHAGGEIIVFLRPSDERMPANAALIVRAVNAYDDMLIALRTAGDLLDSARWPIASAQIRAALAKATTP